jgi:hypothetical protein
MSSGGVIMPSPRFPVEVVRAIMGQFLRKVYVEEGNMGRSDDQLLAELLQSSRYLASIWSMNKNFVTALASDGLHQLLGNRMGYWILPPRPLVYVSRPLPSTVTPAKRHPRIRAERKSG